MPGPVMTVVEVAKLLGINRKTVYEAVAQGHIPHRRFGRRIVFSREAVMQWLAEADPQAEQVGTFLLNGLGGPTRRLLAVASRQNRRKS